MTLIRSISGLRGITETSLTPKVVNDYTLAFAQFCKQGKIIIGRDGRQSGKWIEEIVSKALLDSGLDVELLGIVPTPTVQLCVEKSDAIGGIAITASHNPSEWNGLKFINKDGIFLNQHENEILWKYLDNKKFETKIKKHKSKIYIDENAKQKHIDAIFNIPLFTNSENVSKIKQRKLKVVVDAVNASGSEIIPSLLKEFGCQVIKLFCDGNGDFPHTPEPLPQNLTQLSEVVKKNEADIGIAVDPDADRLVLVDENGVCIGEEKTICIAIESVLSSFLNFEGVYSKSIVVNQSTTALVEYIASKNNAVVYRSPVGEINVVQKMKQTNSIIGGEGSGGVILPVCHFGRDSLVGIALLLSLLALNKLTLSQIANSYPKYYMVKEKFYSSINLHFLLEKIKKLFPYSRIILEDGIKIIDDNSWIQLRSSNTEPIIRIIAESISEQEAKEYIKKVYSIFAK